MKFSVPRTLEGPQREMAECTVLCQCVDAFAKEMKAKLCAKAVKGNRGWDENENAEGMAEVLARMAHEGRIGDEIDIANFAMFLWNLSQD